MKTLKLILFCLAVSSASAQPYSLVFPELASTSFRKLDSNTVWISATFSNKWTPGTAANGILLTNIPRTGITGLFDADTNSILRSGSSAIYTTNSVTITNGTRLILPGTFTNPASMTYTTVTGTADPQWAWAGTTNWTSGLIISTGVVSLAFNSETTPALGTPINPVVSNITVFALERPDLFSRTNKLIGQSLEVSTPTSANQVANKSYVDAAVLGVNYIQNGGVYLSGANLNLDGNWTTSASTNGVVWKYIGVDVLRIANPTLDFGTITWIGMTNTTVHLRVWTNAISANPVPQWTASLVSPAWTEVSGVTNGYPTVVGTNYLISFTRPHATAAFIRIGLASSNPNFAALTALLSTPPRTVTNSSDTTWGKGSGLVTWDTNYLYISVGSNSWKRAGITTW